jgi:hypothetical protein
LVIGATALEAAITYFAVTEADAWLTLDAPTKGALIGGLVGATIGTFLQWGLILFLFWRNHCGGNFEPTRVADDAIQTWSYEMKQAVFNESRPNVDPVDFLKAGASHKCPKCSVIFKLDSKGLKALPGLPGTFVTCPVCFAALSPSAATFVALRG